MVPQAGGGTTQARLPTNHCNMIAVQATGLEPKDRPRKGRVGRSSYSQVRGSVGGFFFFY